MSEESDMRPTESAIDDSRKNDVDVKSIIMPILPRHCEGDCFPMSVEIPMDREPQAIKNHNQTLARLKVRGGLAPSEAVAIMLQKPREAVPRDHLTDYFIRFGWGLT